MALADKKMNGNLDNWDTCFGKELADALNADVSSDDTKTKMGDMGDSIIDLILSASLNEVDINNTNPHSHMVS